MNGAHRVPAERVIGTHDEHTDHGSEHGTDDSQADGPVASPRSRVLTVLQHRAECSVQASICAGMSPSDTNGTQLQIPGVPGVADQE
jgi:hypothetical protein